MDFQHVKPGKGGAFVRTKLKRISDGAAIDKTFRAGEKFRPIRTETRKMQYLYSDGTDAHFMDSQTYEQLPIPEDQLKDSLKWMVENEEVDVLYVDEQPSDVQVPSAVELEVTETEPGAEGRHGLRRRRQAGHARVGRHRAGAAVRERRRPRPRRHPLRRVRLARLGAAVRRTDQRRAAVVALYQDDVTGRPLEELLDPGGNRLHARAGRRRRRPARAARRADRAPREGWTLDRIAPLERNILRVALYELLHRDDIPAEVAIDEAVEAAKELCGADAPGFVNGILGAVQREEVASQ